SSAGRGSLGYERSEPLVHDGGMLELRKVSTVVQPPGFGTPESRPGLPAALRGNDVVLAAVDEEHRRVEHGDRTPIVGRPHHEIGSGVAKRREKGETRGQRVRSA